MEIILYMNKKFNFAEVNTCEVSFSYSLQKKIEIENLSIFFNIHKVKKLDEIKRYMKIYFS